MPKKARPTHTTAANPPPTESPSHNGEVSLTVTARGGAALSAPQIRFNTLMRRLEKARTRHRREKERLDEMLQACGRELMPLIDELHRLNHEMVVHGVAALKSLKFTARRRKAFTRLLHHKAKGLANDSCGLTDEQITAMEQVARELTDPLEEQADVEKRAAALEFIRFMAESAAREAGVEVDLSDLAMDGDEDAFERELQERFDAAMRAKRDAPSPVGARQRATKSTAKKSRQEEIEEAKQRDLKSLYKQLAKVLHPDLEPEPERRLQKEEWMKRLTSAYASDDLRELLAIEMEWMGAESSNLATATDEKLKVYAKVLQDQLDDLNFQTSQLLFEPQYAGLQRFKHPYVNAVLPIAHHKEELLEEIRQHREMLDILRSGPPQSAKMINQWADALARAERKDACPF